MTNLKKILTKKLNGLKKKQQDTHTLFEEYMKERERKENERKAILERTQRLMKTRRKKCSFLCF